MRAYEEALEAVLTAVHPLPPGDIPLREANHRWLAEDLDAVIDLPGFDNSGMDGWAVRTGDLRSSPARLRIAGRSPAGDPTPAAVGAGETVRVFTGAPLPPGADAVVMQEDAAEDPDAPGWLVVHDRVKPWENVRFRGEDIRVGQRILPAGMRLGPAQIGLLAAQGRATVRVGTRPRVTVLPTGSELRVPGDPAGPGPGAIFESNGPMLDALLRGAGAEVSTLAPVPDDPGILAAALGRAIAASDLVVTAGGASVGELDLVQSTLRNLGGEVGLWRIAMRPGKPFFLGRCGGTVVCGVPGNPVSAFVTAVLLVLPAVRRFQGASDPGPPARAGRLAETVANPGTRRHFVRIATASDGTVRPSGTQASHHLGSLAAADGLIDVPAGGVLEAGAPVTVIGWE